LKPKYHKLPSNVAFKFDLRHYTLVRLIRSGLTPVSSFAGGLMDSGVPACHQEATVLALHALRSNDAFFNQVTSPSAKSGLPLEGTRRHVDPKP